MARPSGCLKGCALGCGGLFLLGILAVGGFMLSVRGLANHAVDLRDRLEATLPDQRSFTPPADGGLSTARIERFLEVRSRLMTFCPEFTELAEGMAGMDDHVAELESNPDASPRDLFGLFGRIGRISSGMLGVGRWLGEFSVARNEALLEHEMGLGEYTWIYVLAYYSWLGYEPTNFALGEGERPRIFRDRILGEVRGMMRRQLDELQEEAGPVVVVPEDEEAAQSLLVLLRRELEAMEAESDRLPFAGGLPTEMETSLLPFRERLEAAYCAATSELDFMRTEKGRLGHDHN